MIVETFALEAIQWAMVMEIDHMYVEEREKGKPKPFYKSKPLHDGNSGTYRVYQVLSYIKLGEWNVCAQYPDCSA